MSLLRYHVEDRGFPDLLEVEKSTEDQIFRMENQGKTYLIPLDSNKGKTGFY